MTKSGSIAPNVAAGQQPRISHIPPFASSTGREAIELCEAAGLFLDPWEQFVLTNALNEREDGRWAAFEVGLCVSRQNGKGSILEARELAGLFLLKEPLIIHSAHEFPTSLEHFSRLLGLIEDNPDFDSQVKRVSRSHGDEGIELKGGPRIRFRTRTKGGVRGFTGDLVVFDEAMDISASGHGAILPTLSARSILGDPQVWYTGSAVDRESQGNGVVFSRVRERGINGEDSSLAYFEWSADCEAPQSADQEMLDDPEVWAQANPALGIRISEEHIGRERRSMDDRTFAVERLGIGDWPAADGSDLRVISAETWTACKDMHSKAEDPVCFAFDVTPDRSFASIGASGLRSDSDRHVEVVRHRRGTGWVAEEIEQLTERHQTDEVICDGSGPAGSLVTEIEDRGVEVKVVTAKEYTQACGAFYDACEQTTLHHRDYPELNAAVKGAVKRSLGDAWAYSRKSSSVDISPLVACTLAAWGVAENQAHSDAWVMVGS